MSGRIHIWLQHVAGVLPFFVLFALGPVREAWSQQLQSAACDSSCPVLPLRSDSLSVSILKVSASGESLRGLHSDSPYPVFAYVSVLDLHRRHVAGLANDTRWLSADETAQNGVPVDQIWRPLQEFNHSDTCQIARSNLYSQRPPPAFTEVIIPDPTTTLLVMDASSSMSEIINNEAEKICVAKQGSQLFVDLMRPGDRTGLLVFSRERPGDRLRFTDFTEDAQALRDTIGCVASDRRNTALYDALLLAVDRTKDQPGPRNIIVYTDGLDNASTRDGTPEAVVDQARLADIPIFTIALGEETNEDTLRFIAEGTGGFFRKARNVQEMARAYAEISSFFHSYYVLAYTSPHACCGGRERELSITVVDSSAAGRRSDSDSLVYNTPAPKRYDLELTTEVSAANVLAGSDLTYDLRIRNQGPTTAFNLTLTDSVPHFMTLAPPFDTTRTGALFWHFDSLASGQEMTVSFSGQVTIPGCDPTTLTNYAVLSAACDSILSNNGSQTTVTVAPRPASLQLSKTASIDSIQTGDEFSYALTVTNVSGVPAENITVVDSLPDLVSVVAPDSLAGQRVLRWTFASLTDDTTVTFRVRVDALPSDAVSIVNRSNLAGTCDDEAANNFASDTLFVRKGPRGCDLALSKTASVDTVSAGSRYVYSLSITGATASPAQNVTVVDSLPEFVSVLGADSLALQDNVLSWHFASLQRDTVLSYSVEVGALPSDLSTLINRASLGAACDTDLSDNTASDTVYVTHILRECALNVSTTASVDTISAGDEFSYFITIENVGLNVAAGVTLRDTLPEFVTVIEPAALASQGRVLSWDFATIENDTSVTFRVRVDENLPDVADLTNRVAVNGACGDVVVNNSAQNTVVVRRPVPVAANCDVQLTKGVSADSVSYGQEFVYLLRVQNLGPNSCRDLLVKDALPPEIVPVAFLSQQPDSAAGDTLYWRLATLAAQATFDIEFRAVCPAASQSSGAPRSFMNTALVAAANDTNAANNFASATVVCSAALTCRDIFRLDRNVFEPDRQSDLQITVALDLSQRAEIDLFDITGHHIVTIPTVNAHNGVNTFTWAGNAEDGLRVGSGVYILVCRLFQNGRLIEECVRKVILAR